MSISILVYECVSMGSMLLTILAVLYVCVCVCCNLKQPSIWHKRYQAVRYVCGYMYLSMYVYVCVCADLCMYAIAFSSPLSLW